MPTLVLNHVIVHELIKEAKKDFDHSNIFNYRKDTLDCTNSIVIKLISEISSLYGKKGNAAHFGIFKSEVTEQGPIPSLFENYSVIPTPAKEEFITFSKAVMSQLYQKAKEESWSSGGYIVFSDYLFDSNRFFLITMIKQKEGMRISKDLEPEELTSLDLTKINQAARVSFDRYSLYKIADDIEKTDLSYLSFVSKGTNQSASAYFIAAIGCDKGIASARATTKLPNEVRKFFLKKIELKEKATIFKNEVINYLAHQFDSQQSARLSDIETLATNHMVYLDAEKRESLVDELIAHLNSEETRIPVEFVVNKSSLGKLKNVYHKGNGLNFNFEKSLLGDNPNADVWYNVDTGILSFTKLPEDAKKKIKQALVEMKAILSNEVKGDTN